MKIYHLFLVTVLLLFTFGCQNTSKKPNPNKPSTEENALNQEPKYVQQIPDSLRTPQEKELVKKLLKITIDHVKVIDNQMVFDMSREQFSKTEIPMKYFDLFKKNMKENNKWIEKNNIQNVDKMVQENRRRIRSQLTKEE